MGSGDECHVVKGLVAVRFDPETREEQLEVVQGMLGGEPVTDPDQITRILNDGEGGGEPLDPDVLGQYLESRMTLWEVSPDSEHEIAQAIRGKGVPASPIHAFGRLNHISKMPGTAPGPEFEADEPPNIAKSSPGRAVAVVDSGVTDALPEWLSDSVERDSNVDIERLPVGGKSAVVASHGVFVAGLIRRIAPEHTIHMARTAPRPIGAFTDAHTPGDNPTSELDVAVAIDRLIARLQGALDVEVAALNLSLGGSVCDDDDPVLVILEEALENWRSHFPQCEIFAAGGNTNDARKVFPAAWDDVRAVSAAEDGGRVVVWDTQDNASEPSQRTWITDVAPGAGLTSPSGRTPDSWVHWSGSSFASAVATACFVSRRPSTEADGTTYWRDENVNYADIPGL